MYKPKNTIAAYSLKNAPARSRYMGNRAEQDINGFINAYLKAMSLGQLENK